MKDQTSSENVVGKVINETNQEILSSLKDGYDQAIQSLDVAQSEAWRDISNILETGRKQAEALKRKILGAAEVSARNKSLKLVEDTINEVFASALSDVKEKTSSKKYIDVLNTLVNEAVDALNTKKVILQGREEDLHHLKKIALDVAKERKINLEIGTKIKSSGGVRAMSDDGSVIFDNTFDARLTRGKSLLRKQVADLMSKEK